MINRIQNTNPSVLQAAAEPESTVGRADPAGRLAAGRSALAAGSRGQDPPAAGQRRVAGPSGRIRVAGPPGRDAGPPLPTGAAGEDDACASTAKEVQPFELFLEPNQN